ncbi:TrbC/VirB2 family protein, partial [Candidatus Peregrinibacteria bacterium]|nr:TrbC/VirB2 family protein [Candidatus Peregrinibacteria bacterium]
MKDKSHAMNLKRFATISVLTLSLLFSVHAASADISIDFDSTTTGSDEAQGNVTANDCAQLESSLAASLGCDESSAVSDFTTYGGKLEAPDAGGYDSALTQATDVRSLAQKIVNFALSFLGLIAIIIVIYGGFLYVTSRGEETQATEGKKAIGYAAIGILIILGSYAGVNTLLGATGADTGTGGTTGQTISESGEAFDVRAVLEEVTNIASDYVNSYQTYLKVTQEVAYLKSIEMPLIVDVSTSDNTVSGFFDHIGELISGEDDDYADQYSMISKSDVSDYTEQLRIGLRTIQSNVDSLSTVYETSQGLYNYLRSGTTSYRPFKNIIPSANAYAGTTGCSGREYENQYRDIGLGSTTSDTKISALDDNICSYLDAITEAAASDYSTSVDELESRLATLTKLFDVGGSSGSNLSTLTEYLDTVDSNFEDAGNIENVSAASVSTIVKNMNKIYQTVKNVQFVRAVINVSATSGNAPLIV